MRQPGSNKWDFFSTPLGLYRGEWANAFAKMAHFGYDGVELMLKDPARLDGVSLRRLLDQHHLEGVGICTGHVFGEDGLGLVGPDLHISEPAMDRMKALVDFGATWLGPASLTNIGRARGVGNPADRVRTLMAMTQAFQELADYARPRGVRIVLEPVNSLQAAFIHTTQDGLAMVGRVNLPNFGLMLDVFHMNIEDVDIYDSIREAGDRLWLVHVCDNNRKWPGNAHLDFSQIVATLNEIGYEGFVSLEMLPWPDPDAAARLSIESLRRYIPASKGENLGN